MNRSKFIKRLKQVYGIKDRLNHFDVDNRLVFLTQRDYSISYWKDISSGVFISFDWDRRYNVQVRYFIMGKTDKETFYKEVILPGVLRKAMDLIVSGEEE